VARPTKILYRPAHQLYQDGTKEIISSGTDWKTALSDVVFNSIYTAEHQDARLKQPGWNSPVLMIRVGKMQFR
jgi:alpha-L-rhamnosidase